MLHRDGSRHVGGMQDVIDGSKGSIDHTYQSSGRWKSKYMLQRGVKGGGMAMPVDFQARQRLPRLNEPIVGRGLAKPS